MLCGQVEGACFLDLYAGTGAVGLEALSRGAALTVFVEGNPAHRRLLEENLERTGLGGGARLLALPVARALPRLARDLARFHLVFADPPYRAVAEQQAVLDHLGRGDLLEPQALVVLEHQGRQRAPSADPLEVVREARYGDTALTFYRLAGGP
jgi:16S rRNA (guanine(966)-N(2))-methyltransferase RsmD